MLNQISPKTALFLTLALAITACGQTVKSTHPTGPGATDTLNRTQPVQQPVQQPSDAPTIVDGKPTDIPVLNSGEIAPLPSLPVGLQVPALPGLPSVVVSHGPGPDVVVTYPKQPGEVTTGPTFPEDCEGEEGSIYIWCETGDVFEKIKGIWTIVDHYDASELAKLTKCETAPAKPNAPATPSAPVKPNAPGKKSRNEKRNSNAAAHSRRNSPANSPEKY
ncbi:MAG: hypothetical protein H7222_15240 [Methylotenera sp.]|nr:hypothetical protein [Oligoflexia bacterium]